MSYKYTLIISQFYHSRHMFIVQHTEDFIEKAREFAKELITYKRGDDYHIEETYIGDLDPKYVTKEIRQRYNINDRGDIYFIQSDYANYCKDIAMGYKEDSLREGKGRQPKKITDLISEHHNFQKVKELVEKYFEIV